jgi:hypothetical protein
LNRNIVRPVENQFERVAVSGKAAVGEPFHCCGVLRLDPGQCLRALPLFKPEVGIIVRRFDRGSYINHGHGTLLDPAAAMRAGQYEQSKVPIVAI